MMIHDEPALGAVGMLGTAAAMLFEDVHLQLVTVATHRAQTLAFAKALQRLGTDLTALGAAAAVLVQPATSPLG